MPSTAEWLKARKKYESTDCSKSDIAKGLEVSRQAVHNRAKKEDWEKFTSVDIVKSLDLKCSKTVAGSREGIRSEETLAVLIENFALTGNKSMSCRQAGISDDSLGRWVESEPELAVIMRAARDAHLIGQYKKIANSKDWHAAKEILARAPETSEQWGEHQEKGPQIILNIHRDEVIIEQ